MSAALVMIPCCPWDLAKAMGQDTTPHNMHSLVPVPKVVPVAAMLIGCAYAMLYT
jgi:phosphoribosylcarboxyaminoimidazole (NCAIR) mutase